MTSTTNSSTDSSPIPPVESDRVEATSRIDVSRQAPASPRGATSAYDAIVQPDDPLQAFIHSQIRANAFNQYRTSSSDAPPSLDTAELTQVGTSLYLKSACHLFYLLMCKE